MGTSPSRPCEENCCFQAQNHRSDPHVPTGATVADQKTKEAGEVEEATSGIPPVAGKKEEIKLAYKQEDILKKADPAVDRSSQVKLSADQLEAGVLLSQKRKKYWVDKQSKKNCYMLFARDLAITWAEDNRYWKWQSEKERTSTDVAIDVATLQNVCWLEVHGKFNTAKLSPETLYEVMFVVKLKNPAYGWEVPVNIRLTLPSGFKLGHKENLMEKPREQWLEIPVGEFKTPPTNAGKIEFSMYEYEGGEWKRGLVIKGAIIRPKN